MFEMIVLARREGYDLILYEKAFKHHGDVHPQPIHNVRICDEIVKAVLAPIHEALKKSGHKPSALSQNHRGGFAMDRDTGIRLSLLFMLVAPLKRLDRIADISQHISNMAIEEVCYWHSKCVSPELDKRAQRALRILLAG